MNCGYTGRCDVRVFDFAGNEEENSKRYLKEPGLDIFVPYEILIKILQKVQNKKDKFLSSIISQRNPYGFNTEALTNPEKFGFQPFSLNKIPDGYTILGLDQKQKRSRMYLPKDYKFPKNQISKAFLKYKIFVPEAYGTGKFGEVLGKAELAYPGWCCTATFLEIGCFETENEAKNLIKYIKTKFFRALVGIQKTTQHTGSKAYRFVPILDLNQTMKLLENNQYLKLISNFMKCLSCQKKKLNLLKKKFRI